jgi:Flp pilus assembly protein TadG
MLRDFMRRFARDRNGNVAIIFALSLIPCVFLTGMALDFASATQKRVVLNVAADAAALAAVTPAMMIQQDAAAIQAAQNIFNAEAGAVPGVTSATPTVTITDIGLTRTVLVTYTASSTNSFPNVLGYFNHTSQQSWAISGSSQASATVPPNIDFYLLLDNSPSMALAATTAGIQTMINNTTSQGGCAFACHETANPTSDPDNLGNPGKEDNYTLAKNLGVVTRIQNTAAATQSLMSTATTMENTTKAAYRMAIYTFANSGTSTVQTLTSSLTTAANSAKTVDVIEVCQNNDLVCGTGNNDEDTDFDSAMSSMNNTSVMPNPGTGAAGSTPQEVLFIVTDGVEDKQSATCSETKTGSRCQQEFDITWCSTVKNRGIRIAILYTEYLPLPATGLGSNTWYNSYVAPYQTKIGPNLQNCASPGLYFAVTTDQDISAAMTALFQTAVQTARLTQ